MSATLVTTAASWAFARLDEALDLRAGVDASLSTADELLTFVRRLETARSRLGSLQNPLVLELETRGTARAVGSKNTAELLRAQLHITAAEARRRLLAAEASGSRHNRSGEPVP